MKRKANLAKVSVCMIYNTIQTDTSILLSARLPALKLFLNRSLGMANSG